MKGIYTQSFGLGREFTADLSGSIQRLYEIGFNGIEPFVLFNKQQGNMPKNLWALDTLEMATDKMKQLGMAIPSVHIGVAFGWFSMPAKGIAKNIQLLHEQFGIDNFVMGGTFHSVAAAKHWAKLMTNVSQAVAPFGCHVIYHNHDDEFCKVPVGGKSMEAMEVFLEHTAPEIMLQLDIGWAAVAGDELDITNRYADRIAMLHLKDFYPPYKNGKYTRKNMPPEAFSPMGEGSVKIGEILSLRDRLPNFNGAIIIDQDKTAGEMLKALEVGYKNVCRML